MTHYVKQVGGDHYQAKVQHWDLCEEFDLGYLESNGSKYLDRWARKGTPLQDLEKALSYLEKMRGRAARRVVPMQPLSEWLESRAHDEQTTTALMLIMGIGTQGAVAKATQIVRQLLAEQQAILAEQ